jgi:hypothetical protein
MLADKFKHSKFDIPVVAFYFGRCHYYYQIMVAIRCKVSQVDYDIRDNLGRHRFTVWDAGKVKWED